jgi:hypothetical protein
MSKLYQRPGAASERGHPAGTPLDGYGSASSSTTALHQSPTMSESELMNMAGNDSGWPLLIHYEKWSTLYRNMPNMLLENKGPVARDHLANERNYLAWTRTSLSFATIGLAVTAAFRGYGDGILIVGKIIAGGLQIYLSGDSHVLAPKLLQYRSIVIDWMYSSLHNSCYCSDGHWNIQILHHCYMATARQVPAEQSVHSEYYDRGLLGMYCLVLSIWGPTYNVPF